MFINRSQLWAGMQSIKKGETLIGYAPLPSTLLPQLETAYLGARDDGIQLLDEVGRGLLGDGITKFEVLGFPRDEQGERYWGGLRISYNGARVAFLFPSEEMISHKGRLETRLAGHIKIASAGTLETWERSTLVSQVISSFASLAKRRV